MVFKKDKLVIACVNFHTIWGDKYANLNKILTYTEIASKDGANIIVFPELALTGYYIEPTPRMHLENAEDAKGESSIEIYNLTKNYKNYVVYGMPQKDTNISTKIYNSGVVVGPKGIIGSYKKLMPSVNESRCFSKGNTPFAFDTPWGKIGVGICYDTYMFPELARYYAALDARIYINVTAIAKFPGWRDYYLNQLKARATENMIFLASSNLTGRERELEFAGSSVVLGPVKEYHKLKIFAGPASQSEEEVIYAKIDLSKLDKIRERYPLFTKNPHSGSPDWRLKLFRKMLDKIAKETDLNNFD